MTQQIIFELVCIGDTTTIRQPFVKFADAEAQAKEIMKREDVNYYFINATVCVQVGTKHGVTR